MAELLRRAAEAGLIPAAVPVAMTDGPEDGRRLIEAPVPELDRYCLPYAGRADPLRRLDRPHDEAAAPTNGSSALVARLRWECLAVRIRHGFGSGFLCFAAGVGGAQGDEGGGEQEDAAGEERPPET